MWRVTISLIFLLFSQTLCAESGLVVISSNYSQVERGDIIHVGQIIELPANKSLRLISASGNVFDLQGPYEGTIELSSTRGNDSILKSVSRLVKDSKATDYTLATFRGGSIASLENRHDIWGVDIRKPGNYCVRPNRPVYLWWPQASPGEQITLTDQGSSRSIVLEWPYDKKYALWPEEIGINDHSTFTAKSDQIVHFAEFRVLSLPKELTENMEVVAWMSDHQCRNQAVRLLGAIMSKN